jgi:hypothetical protein
LGETLVGAFAVGESTFRDGGDGFDGFWFAALEVS